MKVVVLGAAGLLGRHVVQELAGHDVLALGRADCDVTDPSSVSAHVAGRDLVINCAAFTDVDGAEKDEEGAYRANAIGAESAALAARRHGAKLVHVSTDFVFDGSEPSGYDEFAVPRPISTYGHSKWAGEQLARAAHDRVFIVRVQGLYGVGGKNFSSRMRALIAAEKPLLLDGQRRVQPTWARAAARQLLALAETDHPGTYHVSCSGSGTWADFARLIAERLGVAPAWQEVATAALGGLAARPAHSLFIPRMSTLRGLPRMPTWESSLEGYLEEASEEEKR